MVAEACIWALPTELRAIKKNFTGSALVVDKTYFTASDVCEGDMIMISVITIPATAHN